MRLAILLLALCLPGCSDESLSRSDVPLGRTAAMKLLDLPLPASAHDVYYLDFVGGMQDLDRFIRFDTDPKELDAAVEALRQTNSMSIMDVTLSVARQRYPDLLD